MDDSLAWVQPETRKRRGLTSRTGSWLAAGVIVALYVAALIILLQRHEFWRDEMQAWMLARDSSGLSVLLGNMRYEGHPALWHLLLMPLTRISHDPMLMQALNAVLAVALVVLVAVRSPFTWIEKALFPFGVFILPEYGVVSRSYMLGFLVVAVICALWPSRRTPRGLLAIGILLAVLCNVHILYAVVAIAFLLALAADRFFAPDDGRQNLKWLLAAAALTAAGLAAALAVAVPEADSPVGSWQEWSILRNIGGIGALFGSPNFLFAAVPAVLLILWYLRRDVPAFVLLASGLFGLILFQYLFYDFRMRHGGIYLSCLFASMWLNREGPAPAGLVPRALWGVALAASAYVGFLLAGRNIDLPRSYGCATAEFIRSSGWAGDPLIGFPAKQSSTVVGCGQFPRAYYADAGAWGSFVVWNSNIPAVGAPVAADPAEALRRAVGITGAPVTLIAGYGVEEGVAEQLGFRKVADFREPGPIMTDEIYTLYRLEAR